MQPRCFLFEPEALADLPDHFILNVSAVLNVDRLAPKAHEGVRCESGIGRRWSYSGRNERTLKAYTMKCYRLNHSLLDQMCADRHVDTEAGPLGSAFHGRSHGKGGTYLRSSEEDRVGILRTSRTPLDSIFSSFL